MLKTSCCHHFPPLSLSNSTSLHRATVPSSSLSTPPIFFTQTSLLYPLPPPSFQFEHTYLNHTNIPLRKPRNGFVSNVTKKNRKRGKVAFLDMEMEGSDYEDENEYHNDYGDEEEEEEEGGEEDDDDDGLVMPLRKMKEWIDNKPKGFGFGKEYDTSLEDKLLDEVEQSRQAQIININRLKSTMAKPTSKNDDKNLIKAPQASPTGIRVRVGNLPKKKNVHRDLKIAFGGVPGLLDIHPAVSGNKKTRDPVCKGFAFVDFKSEEDAIRFVQMYSRQNLLFGKVQKQIRCQMINQNHPISAWEKSVGASDAVPASAISDMEGDPVTQLDIDEPASDSRGNFSSDEEDGADNLAQLDFEGIREGMESISICGIDNNNSLEPGTNFTSTLLTEHQEKAAVSMKLLSKDRVNKKKPTVKGKGQNVFKLEVPGSAKRLKVKEKAVLTDVFSKYGAKGPSLRDTELSR